MLTCSIRKVSTGHKVSSFRGDRIDQLHLVAVTLMASPEYAGCYIVCTDERKNVHFNLQPQQMQQHYQPAAQVHAHAPRLQQAPHRPRVIDAEFDE